MDAGIGSNQGPHHRVESKLQHFLSRASKPSVHCRDAIHVILERGGGDTVDDEDPVKRRIGSARNDHNIVVAISVGDGSVRLRTDIG